MRIAGILLIVIGLAWAVLCYLGIMMMSRSVDMFREAFLPSLLGLAVAGLGVWLFGKGGDATRNSG